MNNFSTICVCGAGTMGSGIAQLAATAGYAIIQFDVQEEMLAKSRSAIEKNLQFLEDRQKITTQERHDILARIRFTADANDCTANIAIEAIIENREAKLQLFNRLAELNGADLILATNTSSLSITEIAAGVPHPERVIGMHFFNPAPLMKLVEVITTTHTATVVTETITELARRMGKTPVLCNDAPGFIVNRVARHYYLEAMKLVEQGHATIETIDKVMEASGFKMGPFKLMDLIGMDINYGVSQIVWEALGKPERLRPSPLQQRKVESGELGRKTGSGFYQY